MAIATEPRLGQDVRLGVLFERLAELQGQRNVIDAQIVDVVRALDEDDLWGVTGSRSLESCVAWKTGSSASHAHALAAVARRAETFPRCVAGLRAGSLSLDQVAVIAERAVEELPEVEACWRPAVERFAALAQGRGRVQLPLVQG